MLINLSLRAKIGISALFFFLQKSVFHGTSDTVWAGRKNAAKGGQIILGFIFNPSIADIIMTF